MNTVRVIYEYDRIMNRLEEEIRNSNFKIQYFLDLLHLKRSFFYKKLKEKRFTSTEMKLLSKSLILVPTNTVGSKPASIIIIAIKEVGEAVFSAH